MGVSISKYSDLSSNELIERFCSDDVISPNDPFWNQLLAFNITPPSNIEEQLFFDSSTEAFLQKLLINNPQTGNLGSLIQVFITRATELLASPSTDNAMLAWQTFNALFVIRAVTKYLVEMIPEYQLGQHFDVQCERRPRAHTNDVMQNHTAQDKTPSDQPSPVNQTDNHTDSPTDTDTPVKQDSISPESKTFYNESRLEMLCDALIGLICDIPVTDNTYYLHLECMNTLLVLMSVYMFATVHGDTRLVESSFVFRTLFQGRYGIHAPLLVKTLLHNFSTMQSAPLNMFGYTNNGGSVVINLASGLWNMLTFSATSTHRPNIFTTPPLDKRELAERLCTDHGVSNQSCLLLLCLASHCMNEDNLYRKSLLCATDTIETSTTPSKESNPGLQMTPPRIDMAALHKAICATASCEHTTLLLYLMLHSCSAYKKHVFNEPQIENLILPILQCLYNAPEHSSHHIYMSLIVLLILTEDEALTKNIHLITVKNPLWYTERALSEISLGGLVILVIIRTVQYNIVRVRDKYLHTNCLAALANMSSEFRNLHPYVSQRLVSLFETLSKRSTRLCAELERSQEGNVIEDKAEELWEHICVLDEVLRMLLEILNSCLSSQLTNNLNLVYALLHKKSVFTLYKSQPRHAPILNNIEMVIGFFSSRLQRYQEHAGTDLGVTEVLQCIKKGAEQWSSDRLKKFPELKFRYVEEDKPEEFFTPYVWALISTCGSIFWASECGARVVRDLVAS